MKKILQQLFGLISALALTIASFSSALASNSSAQTGQIYRSLSTTNSTGLNFETSGVVEKITTTSDGWLMQAGGDVASTHYARARYKLPEAEGVVFTYFYAKAVIVLPPDFYSQQKAGFRILNTDNYPATLNGASVGASNANELRVAVYIFTDHKLRVQVNHETGIKETLYTAPTILPTGEHTFELAGDVANAAPWYLKVDGVVVASGVKRLSTDDMVDSERVITRIVAGIDGAASQDTNSMNLLVKSLEFANYDVSGIAATPVPTTISQGVFRPSNGLMYLKNASTTGSSDVAINYGKGGDYPVIGDWDGNGTDTIGIYRNGSFYLRNFNTPGYADLVFAFGTPDDQPVAGDWDGDGIDTVGVYRSSTGQFLLRNSNKQGDPDMSFYLGNVGDVGIVGDWNGDGVDTTGVFRPGNGVIFLKNANTTGFADIALNYGLPGDRPVIGDWNNDGIDTIGVYRNTQFLLRNSNTIGFADIVFNLGIPGDIPIAGHWNGVP